MKPPRVAEWRSEAARQRFIEMEDELWRERWPEPPVALDVDSYAGTTRVYRWPGMGVPIVFLHGMGGTGLSWSPYVEALAGRDLYAVDTIGDVGRSQQRAVIEDANGLATWLAETLTDCGIERAHVVGTSYGGFIALSLAVHAGARVSSLTLIDSAGLAPFRLGRFMLWGLPNLFGSLAPGPLRRRLARRRPLLEDPRIMRIALHAQMNHPFSPRRGTAHRRGAHVDHSADGRDRGGQECAVRPADPGRTGRVDTERQCRNHPRRSSRLVLEPRRPLRRLPEPDRDITQTRR